MSKRHWTYTGERNRKDALRRDNYECQLRFTGCLVIATTVDHRIPRLFGGTDAIDNLQAACDPCNKKKGTKVSLSTPPRFFRGTADRRGPLPKISLQNSRYAVEPRDYSRKAPE